MANSETRKPDKSDAMCVASLINARLFDIIPPVKKAIKLHELHLITLSLHNVQGM